MLNIEFSFVRFVRTLRYSWQTQSVLPYYVALGLAPFVFYGLAEGFTAEGPFICWSLLLSICGGLYAGMSFQEFSHPVRGRQYLSIPASVTEKWLAKFLLAFVVFPGLITVFFRIMLGLFNLMAVRIWVLRYGPMDWSSDTVQIFLFFFFLLLPLAFVSGLFWKKYGLIKTVITLAVLFFVLLNLDSLMMYQSNNEVVTVMNLLTVPVLDASVSPEYSGLSTRFWLFGGYIPSFLLLVASYLLLKNKEI
jgi:hypothetical protein